jgi:hypothetical protein
MWKKYNKLKNRSTVNIEEEELESHREALIFIQRDLHFSQQNATEIEDEDDE